MRLIDADELKKTLHNFFNGKVIDEPAYILRDVLCHIDNAPTVKPSLNLDNVTDDDIKKFKMVWQRATSKGLLLINEERPIRCKDCKHQEKYWHEDKRIKEGGYWVYDCNFISDPYESTPVCGQPDEYCSSAEMKGEEE